MPHSRQLSFLALLLGVAALVGVAACTRGGDATLDPETLAIHQAVTDYNDALVDTFATLDLGHLESVATTEQAADESYTLMQLQSENAVMNAELVSIEFGDVIVYAEDDVSITTHETWNYDYVSLETSEPIRAERGVTYDLRYDLVLKDGRWLVYAVDAFDVAPNAETTP